MLFIQSLFAISLLTGCSSEEDGKPVSWADLKLEGKSLELIDDTRLEAFHFNSDSMASAELGQKHGNMFGSIYYWRIEQNELVISEGPGSEATFRLYEPRFNNNIVTARRNFLQTARYRLQAR